MLQNADILALFHPMQPVYVLGFVNYNSGEILRGEKRVT